MTYGQKPQRLCTIEELGVDQINRPSGGMLFARNQERELKDAARRAILDLFTADAWPGHLRMLTMPGLEWRFERKLLGRREGNWMRKVGPGRTALTCAENDRYIYYSAATTMPGLHTKDALTKSLPAPAYAERSVGTKFIEAFHFADVDDLMRENTRDVDAAWLDYTGPLSIDRLEILRQFYLARVGAILIVTALKARWDRMTGHAIRRAGGHDKWVRQYLPGEVLHDIAYKDTAPMVQFAVRKVQHERAEGQHHPQRPPVALPVGG